jgi:hypothetical protein
MKLRNELIWVMCCLVLAGCAGPGMRVASFQNEPEGFRGIRWGQNIGEVRNMQLVSRDNKGMSVYSRNVDILSLGEAKLRRVRYVFWQKKFLEAQMYADPDQLQALKRVVYEQYGEGHNPYGPTSNVHDYSWVGPVASVRLSRTNFMADCEVKITSREISNQMNHALKIKAKTHPGATLDTR